MHSSYRNLGYILLVFPLIIVAGFWIPYFSQIPKFDSSITTAVHIHALLLFAWVGLLVIEPLTARNGAFSIHRILAPKGQSNPRSASDTLAPSPMMMWSSSRMSTRPSASLTRWVINSSA